MFYDEVLGIAYLNMIVFGILGNSFLLYQFSVKFITNHRTRSINLIIIHLAFANVTMILFRSIPTIMSVWGPTSSLDGTGKKIIMYLLGVVRSLFFCSTCLLCVFQAITINSNIPMWMKLKTRDPKYIITCCFLLWIYNLLIDVIVPVYVVGLMNSTDTEKRWSTGYIHIDFYNANTVKIIIWKSVCYIAFLCLMVFSSGYMVFILYSHNQQIQYIHSTKISPRASPEIRATKAILLLVITFVCFNSVSSPLIVFMASSKVIRVQVVHITVLLSLCYPVVSPFMLISIDHQIS
ncbi:vomeronasal type-1 receptor 1-like [Sarcophilus harrisii]|uniref:Vomeronasal type-1 receptor n=1 Tax=Sarcophilus harrisii TaxID=9305 RepID=G3VSD8_SARHA|nr:vomeronasal type-1 receptor 1-like [Sarcophilus harrisii]